jgi:tetratricopeptide (TPR) repeat protein
MISRQEFEQAKYRHAQHYLMGLKTYARLYGENNQAQLAVRQLKKDWHQIEYCLDWATNNGAERGAELCLAFCEAGGLLLTDLQDFQRRLNWHTTALRAAQRLERPGSVALQLFRLGTLHRDLAKYETAQDYLRQSLALARESGMQELIADCYHESGVVARRLGQQNEAWNLVQQALEVARTLDSDTRIASCLRSLSIIAYEKGEVEAAIRFARESHAIFEAVGSPRDVAHLAYTIGSFLLSDEAQLEDARRFLWQSHDTFNRIGYKRLAASAACNIAADLIRNLGDFEQAVQLAEDALATYRSLDYSLGVCNALTVLGDAALKQGEFQGARERYAEGLALARETRSTWDIINLLLGLGRVANQARQFDQARQHLSEALKLALEGQMAGLALLALAQLAIPLADQNEQVERAVEIIGLVLGQPAATSDVIREAETVLTRLKNELPAQAVDQALERGRRLDFDSVTQEYVRAFDASRSGGDPDSEGEYHVNH